MHCLTKYVRAVSSSPPLRMRNIMKQYKSPEVALTVAIVGALEVQVTLLVTFAVLVSLNVPVAVNCCVNPEATLGAFGVTAIDTNPLRNETRAVLVWPLNR